MVGVAEVRAVIWAQAPLEMKRKHAILITAHQTAAAWTTVREIFDRERKLKSNVGQKKPGKYTKSMSISFI